MSNQLSLLSAEEKVSISLWRKIRDSEHLWAGREFKEPLLQPLVLQRKKLWSREQIQLAQAHTVTVQA